MDKNFAGLARGGLAAGIVDDAHTHPRKRPTHRGGDHVGRVIVSAHADGPRRLGQPVAGHDRVEAQLLAHAPDHFHGHGGRARHGQAQ